MALVVTLASGELLACGDKFLVGSRGTRYQRPKTARAAAIVIYTDPSAAADTARVESLLTRHGHHPTIATTLEQLSAILKTGRFDVVLAANDVAAKVHQLFAATPATPAAAVVVAFNASPKTAKLLEAIDKAVEQHDHDLRTSRTRT